MPNNYSAVLIVGKKHIYIYVYVVTIKCGVVWCGAVCKHLKPKVLNMYGGPSIT